jgi:hypothetical protein
MYYIFNKDGNCVCVANYELDKDDLSSREEIAIESNEIFDIQQIKLVDGEITISTPSLDKLKTQKINEFKNIRDTEEVKPIEYNGNLFDFDEKARDRINSAIIALDIAGEGASLSWTTANNTEAIMTANDLRAIIAAVAVRSNKLHIRYRNAKAKVEEAQTAEELEAIEL